MSAFTNNEKHDCMLQAGSDTRVSGFGLQAGSMVLTGETSRALMQTRCARSLLAAEMSPSPSPPLIASPPPPTSPGGDSSSTGAVIGISASSMSGAVLGIGLCLLCCMLAGDEADGREGDENNAKGALIKKQTGRLDEGAGRLDEGASKKFNAAYRGRAPPAATTLSFNLKTAFEKF